MVSLSHRHLPDHPVPAVSRWIDQRSNPPVRKGCCDRCWRLPRGFAWAGISEKYETTALRGFPPPGGIGEPRRIRKVLQPLMAIVFAFRDGRSLNRESIAAGFAGWFRIYSTDRSLEVRERSARRERHGLWGRPGPDAAVGFSGEQTAQNNRQRKFCPGELIKLPLGHLFFKAAGSAVAKSYSMW